MSSNNSPVLGPMNSATPGSSGIAANSAGMSDLALKDIYSLVHLITVPEKVGFVSWFCCLCCNNSQLTTLAGERSS